MPKHSTITKAAADRFRAKGGRVDHFDSSYPGLALRVSPTGRKAWTYFYRLQNGKVIQRRMTLGIYPAMSVEQAHEAWRKARDLVAAGRDPAAVEDTDLPAQSVESVIDEWLKRDQSKHRSGKHVKRRFELYVLPSWKGRLITDIDKRAALAVIDDIADSGKVVLARRMFAHLHRLFVWSVGRGILEKNPLQHAERPRSETARDRVLTDAELVKVWNASEELSPANRDAFRLLVLTGARREEISQLHWGEVQDNAIHLDGARTKNGEAHIIPLSTAALAILPERGDRRVFAAIKTWPRAKAKLDKVSGVTGWVIHDLRRTVATGLQKLGVQLPVTESVLGHSGGSRSGIVGVYQRHDYASEKAAALEAWGAHVMALVEGSERGKVTAFRRG
jgi:integrase